MWSLLGSTVATGAGLLGGNLAFGHTKAWRGQLGRSNLLLPFHLGWGTAVAAGAYKPPVNPSVTAATSEIDELTVAVLRGARDRHRVG